MFARRSMAVCPVRDRLVFFGGVGAGGTESILDVSNDGWLFDPSSLSWQRLADEGPRPSARRCVGVAPTPAGMFLWGGSGLVNTGPAVRYDFLNDWWQLDITSQRWSQLRDTDDHRVSPVAGSETTYPSPRYTPAFVNRGDDLFLYGGYTEDRLGKRKLDDTWIYRRGEWQLVAAEGAPGYAKDAARPGPRYGCLFTIAHGMVFVFGGFSDTGDHNDLWQFDMTTCQWSLVLPESSSESVPIARYCGAFVHHDRRLFLFGGRSRKNPKANYNDLWSFDIAARRWECLSPNRSPHRYDASAEYPGYHAKASAAAVGGHWYLWGGEGVHGHVSDFWRFSFADARWDLIQAARRDDPVLW